MVVVLSYMLARVDRNGTIPFTIMMLLLLDDDKKSVLLLHTNHDGRSDIRRKSWLAKQEG